MDESISVSNARVEGARGTLPFFVAALGISWLLQLPALLALRGIIAGPVLRYAGLAGLGAFGPLFAALLVARFDGSSVRTLLRPLGKWRVSVRWYLVALFLPGAILFVGMAIDRLLGKVEGPWLYAPASAQRIVVMLLLPLAEEIGWRGIAQPRLQRRYGRLPASVILGVVWGMWHVPMFMLQGYSLTPILFLFFIPGSIVFNWIYNRTNGGLLFAVLAHVGAHLNNSHLALPQNTRPLVIHTVGYAIVACALVIFDREAWRTRDS